MKEEQVDVVIIGGGLAGLSTAYALAQLPTGEGPPPSFVVLECDGGLGGRVQTDPDDFFDYGAGYIGGSQHYVQLLVRQLQLPTFRQYLPHDKEWLYQSGSGAIKRFPGNDPYDLPGGMDAVICLDRLDTMSALIRANMHQPERTPGGMVWDGMTVRQWMNEELKAKRMTPETAEVLMVSVRSAFSVEPEELSMLFLLYYAGAAGSYSALVDVTGGESAAEGTRLTYGCGSIVEALGAQLQEHIVVNARVDEIQHPSPDRAVVSATVGGKDKQVWAARKVVVAMSPRNSRDLKFVPALRAKYMEDGVAREELAANTTMGRSIKGFVRYKRPFWRDKGLMGYLLSAADYEKFPLDWTLDNSWEPAAGQRIDARGRPRNRYSLMTFIVGASADFWGKTGLSARRDAVVNQLVAVYGPEAKTELVDGEYYREALWIPGSKQRVGGGPTGVFPPNCLSKFGAALRKPLGPIHFAGTESASEWIGYMNGAIQSGFRVASEVVEAMQARPSPSVPVKNGQAARLSRRRARPPSTSRVVTNDLSNRRLRGKKPPV